MKRKFSDVDLDESALPSKKPNIHTSIESCFRPDLFSTETTNHFQDSYATSQPYPHAVIPSLISPAVLDSVRQEIQTHVHFTLKETDIYRIHQSGDLANLSKLDSDALKHLPSLLQLRDALYSEQFRGFVSRVTGAGKLSGRKTDMAVNVYTPGSYLLCHDDVIGSRRVSYILYLTDAGRPWKKEWGGGLRLYPTEIKTNSKGEEVKVPLPDHTVNIPPAFGQLSFFAVRPGESFHDVEEVYHSDPGSRADDGGRIRMAISGWYHIPQEGEDGYEVGFEEKMAEKSSLAQLQGGAGDEFDEPKETFVEFNEPQGGDTREKSRGLEEGGNGAEAATNGATTASATESIRQREKSAVYNDPQADTEENEEDLLTESDLTFLLNYISPSYLTPDMAETLSTSFTENSFLQLNDFLRPTFAGSLKANVVDHGRETYPDTEDAGQSLWHTARPPHKHRYKFLSASDFLPKSTKGSSNKKHMPPATLLLAKLLPSYAFRKWLGLVTGLGSSNLLRHNTLIRRFRRGKDYALASTYAGDQPRLEFTLGITPTDGWGDVDNAVDGEEDPGTKEKKQTNGINGHKPQHHHYSSSTSIQQWIEVGGEEVYMAGEEDDDNTSIHSKGLPHTGNKSRADPAVYRSAKDEEDDDDSILFTNSACWNRLSIVLRDKGTMRFVKYVGRAAKGDRWDVKGEVEVGEGTFVEDEEEEGEGGSVGDGSDAGEMEGDEDVVGEDELDDDNEENHGDQDE